MAPEFRIVMQTGPTSGKEFLINKQESFVGRDLNNDIVINDAEISRRHARIYLEAGHAVLEDLGSTNGSFVNGQRLSSPYILRPGELITFGERISLLFESLSPETDATVAVPSARPSARPKPAQPSAGADYGNAPVPPPPGTLPQSGSVPAPAYPPPAPHFAGQVPMAPVNRSAGGQGKKMPTWALILLILGAILVVFCLLPALILEMTNSWCSLLGGIFNAFMPGACPIQ